MRCDARGASGGRPRDARGVDEGRIRGSGLTSPCAQPHRGSRDSPCDPSPPTNPARQPRPAATHFFIPPRSAAAAAAAATAASGRSSDAPSRRGNSDRRAEQALVSSGTIDAPERTVRRGRSRAAPQGGERFRSRDLAFIFPRKWKICARELWLEMKLGLANRHSLAHSTPNRKRDSRIKTPKVTNSFNILSGFPGILQTFPNVEQFVTTDGQR